MKVSDDVRTWNRFWTQERHKWRMRYRVISDMIREQKHVCRTNPNSSYEQRRLNELRTMANYLMMERDDIRHGLIDTQYRYV